MAVIFFFLWYLEFLIIRIWELEFLKVFMNFFLFFFSLLEFYLLKRKEKIENVMQWTDVFPQETRPWLNGINPMMQRVDAEVDVTVLIECDDRARVNGRVSFRAFIKIPIKIPFLSFWTINLIILFLGYCAREDVEPRIFRYSRRKVI